MKTAWPSRALAFLPVLLLFPLGAGAAEPLRIFGNTTTFELAPVLLAAERIHGEPVQISNGGVPDLFKPGGAELATNAETQALRVSVDNPDLRIILTVSEGLYRIVARRSAGITKLADLKGKRIATIGVTSSGYFLNRMLDSVGLSDRDVTIVPLLPLSRMVDALGNREVDAVTIWEPEMQHAAERIGEDAIEFSGRGIYREMFNLNTTAPQLADPVQRQRIVAFVRSVLLATKRLHAEPAEAWSLVSRSSKYDESTVAKTWHHHAYPGIIVPDMLDVLEKEEIWSARERNRTPRSRAQLATLIDDSVLREVIAADPTLAIVAPTPEAVHAQTNRLRVERLAANVRNARALRQIKRVQHALNHYREAGASREAAALFTRDATAKFADGEVVGRASIMQRLADEGRGAPGPLPRGRLNTHLALSPVVTLDPDGLRARGRWHEVSMTGTFGVSADWAGGIHENEYAIEDGAWKIARLHYYPSFVGPYAPGWRNADRSPTVTIVPFHYTPAGAGTPIPAAPRAVRSDRAGSGAAQRSRVLQLQGELARLRDETLVHNLQSAWGYYSDRRMWDDVADLFAEDGTLEIAQRGVFVGKAGVRRGLESMGPANLAPGVLNDRLQLQPVITVAADGNSAQARGTELVMAGRNGEEAWWGINIFENRYSKQGGVWRLQSAHVYQRLRTDYALGWANSAFPVEGPLPQFAPDRASTVKYATYPDSFTPPIHFANPGRTARNARTAAPRSSASLDDLLLAAERDLEGAVAVDASENIANAYGYYIDEFLWDNTADLFSENGSKELSYIGNYIGRERVRDSMVARYGRNGRRAGSLAIHQKTQPYVTVAPDGRSTMLRAKLFQIGSAMDSAGSFISGIYENATVKEAGVWKISRMDLDYTWTAGYANGWAKVAVTPPRAPAAAPAISVAPDGPLRGVTYPPYPQVAPMAFHFRNPVSGRDPPELLAP